MSRDVITEEGSRAVKSAFKYMSLQGPSDVVIAYLHFGYTYVFFSKLQCGHSGMPVTTHS